MHKKEDASLIEFASPQPSRTIGMVRAKGKYLTPAAKVFIEELQHLAQNLSRTKGRRASAKG